MQNFEYFTPTKVVFGRDSERETARLVKEQGASRLLLHYGGGSAERSGLLGRIKENLDENGLSYVCLGGVAPNPRLSLVQKGISLCKNEQVDFILAIGGGSVIDSAKAIGYGLYHDGDVWDFYDMVRKPEGCIPIGCVLTIAAAGSEMSNSSVITNDLVAGGGIKRGCNSDHSRCRFAVMNPELTFSLPSYQTACGITDILMHTMERYFIKEPAMDMTDGIAEALIRTVIKNGPILMKEPSHYDARAEIMWAGSLSHNGLTGCGGAGDWATHQMEHELSGLFDVAHGAGLAALWGAWARYVYPDQPQRFAHFARQIFGIGGDDEAAAIGGIDAMEKFFESIGMPVCIHELIGREITDAEIEDMTVKCAHHGRTIGGFKTLGIDQIRTIYQNAR